MAVLLRPTTTLYQVDFLSINTVDVLTMVLEILYRIEVYAASKIGTRNRLADI